MTRVTYKDATDLKTNSTHVPYLENLACLDDALGAFDHLEDRVELVNDLAWNEATEAVLHVLHEGHAQQRDPGLDGGEDLVMLGQRMA